MRKLRLLAATLAAVLVAVAAPTAAMADTSTPEPTPPPITSFFFGTEDEDTETAEDTATDDLEDWLDLLFENTPGPYYGPGYGYDGCSPFSSWCYNDPFYGSCQWDMFYGQYICADYVPGFGCSWYYDYWWGGYPCTGRTAWGWY